MVWLLSGACGHALDDRARTLGHLLGGEAEVLVQVGLGRRLAEGRHRDRAALLADPRAPTERRGRLDGHTRPHAAREDAVSLAFVQLGYAGSSSALITGG